MSENPKTSKTFRLRLREINVADKDLLEDLRRVAAEFGNDRVSIHLYDKHGKYNSTTLKRRFRTWNTALERAGISLNNELDVPTSRLFENLEHVWVSMGRQPRIIEMAKPRSAYVGTTYQRRFGSWNKALLAFIQYIEGNEPTIEPVPDEGSQKASLPSRRGVDLRTRFRVMQRDNFKCRICGGSPATSPGVILHIDHIVPWSKNGPTEIQNLQTLCDRCNLGKGNLDQ